MPTNADPDPEPPVSRETLLDAQLRAAKDTHHVEIRRIRIAPNHAGGPHVHNGPVVGSIVEGSVYFQVEGEPETILGPGDVFFEPEGVRIERFDARDDGVTFLAYFLLTAEQQPEISFAGE